MSESRLAQWEAENSRLQAEATRFQAEAGRLDAENTQLQAEQEEVQQLQRRLGLGSSNSGKPPSSTGLAKPPGYRARPCARRRARIGSRAIGRRPASAAARPWSRRTGRARRSGDKSRNCPHPNRRWRAPGLELSLPAVRRADAGRLARGCHGSGVQSRPRLAATAVSLQHARCLPEARWAEVFRELCGFTLSTGTLARLRRHAAHNWEAWVVRRREHWVRGPGVQWTDTHLVDRQDGVEEGRRKGL